MEKNSRRSSPLSPPNRHRYQYRVIKRASKVQQAKAKVYEKLDQKNVTAWLDLRNKAAHGEYEKYGGPQVGLMIAGIRDFLTRHPA